MRSLANVSLSTAVRRAHHSSSSQQTHKTDTFPDFQSVRSDTSASSGYCFKTTSARALIPEDLHMAEDRVYQKLIAVAERHEKSRQKPRLIVVITDVGKDYDDLAALTVLKELHRLRIVKLQLVVANLMPSDKRARFARDALDSLGLEDTEVPVARGTRGSIDEHEEMAHEFSGAGFVATSDQSASSPQDGQDLLFHIYQNARSMGEKLYLLCLSSLQDINEFASNHPELVAEITAEVHMQGGNYISTEGNLEPDCKAANNRFNLDAAKEWHHFIQTNGIPSYTYTKIAAFAAPLVSEVFVALEATGHPIGAYLRRVQVEQDLAFYKRACENDSEKRFAPFMDQKWFLANKTNWHLRPHPSDGDALPTGEEVIPYLTKIVLYDVHAALGVAGEDVISELNIFKGKVRCIEIHKAGSKVVGRHRISCDDQSTMDPDEVNATVVALSALMKGSLLAVQEGLPSKKFEVGFSLHNSVSPVTRNIRVTNLSIEMLPQEKIRGRKKGSLQLAVQAEGLSSDKFKVGITLDNRRRVSPVVPNSRVTKDCPLIFAVDSGASAHVTGISYLLYNVSPPSDVTSIETASGQILAVQHKGTLRLRWGKVTRTIQDFLYVPGLTMNLLSVGCLTDLGHRVEFYGNLCLIYDNLHPGQIYLVAERFGRGGLHILIICKFVYRCYLDHLEVCIQSGRTFRILRMCERRFSEEQVYWSIRKPLGDRSSCEVVKRDGGSNNMPSPHQAVTVMALSALMKGSLLAVQEGLSSKKIEVGFSSHNSVSPVTGNIRVTNLSILEKLRQDKMLGRKKRKAYATLFCFAKLVKMKRTSFYKRSQVISLSGQGFCQYLIAGHLHIPCGTNGGILAQYKEDGPLYDRPRSGRSRLLGIRDERLTVRMFNEPKSGNAIVVGSKVRAQGLRLSTKTARRCFLWQGLGSRVKKKPLFTKKCRHKCSLT